LKRAARAYAKVNLHLEVLNKRQDGYHNILSVMAQVDLFDLLKLKHIRVSGRNGELAVDVRVEGGDFAGILGSVRLRRISLRGRAVPTSWLWGAQARSYFQFEKNIPAGAGLGGGSSDAAAALRMLNEYFSSGLGVKLDDGDLARLGAGIGADVPFCLAGGAAVCEGIGEIMEPVSNGLSHRVVIAYNGVQVSTAEARIGRSGGAGGGLFDARACGTARASSRVHSGRGFRNSEKTRTQ
jgi:4-diphosphocytidyl-2-C-methyl-D-erythritol kinase